MNYIATTLNNGLKCRTQTIGVFIGLIHSKKLKGLFSGSVPEYHLKAHVMHKIMQENLPTLAAHFKRL